MRTVSILAFLFLQAAWLASCGFNSSKGKELNTPKAENTSALGGQPIAEKDAEAQAAFVPEESLDEQQMNGGMGMLYKFYKAYLSCTIDHDTQVRLWNKYMTKAMQDKADRMGNNIGADAVIRAQDMPEDSCESLRIEPLENDWYMVNITYARGTPYESKAEIPVKVVRDNGEYKIGYITPEYLGQAYGDSLLCQTSTLPTVDRSEAVAFIESFYDLYITKYGSLLSDLQTELAALRKEYLTPRARQQFDRAEEYNRGDGFPEYDLLIAAFDIEYIRHSSIRATPAETPDTYYINVGDSTRVEVAKIDGKYCIDGIYNRYSDSYNGQE